MKVNVEVEIDDNFWERFTNWVSERRVTPQEFTQDAVDEWTDECKNCPDFPN